MSAAEALKAARAAGIRLGIDGDALTKHAKHRRPACLVSCCYWDQPKKDWMTYDVLRCEMRGTR
jgi:hypothetical protein